MWGLLVVSVGLLYGWMTPSERDVGRLLWNGFLMGIVVALVATLLGAALEARPLPFGAGIAGVVLTILVLTLAFVAGAWLGGLAQAATSGRRSSG